jgi:hypothetical protein
MKNSKEFFVPESPARKIPKKSGIPNKKTATCKKDIAVIYDFRKVFNTFRARII